MHFNRINRGVAALALTLLVLAAIPALAPAAFTPGEFVVKGKTATKVFHAPGGAYYTRTRADVWFRTADDARAAGFTERAPRRHG